MKSVTFQTLLLLVFVGFVHHTADALGTTQRVSVDADALEVDGGSFEPALSADGRFVAFTSSATNLVPEDTNEWDDVFVRDQQSGQITRVSVASNGAQADDESYDPALSADGRFVAFVSYATNLVLEDTNEWDDVFVRDQQSGQITRVSVASNGAQADGGSYAPTFSADGRFVAFASGATTLVPEDTNERDDVFVHDRQSGQTTRVSVDADEREVDGSSSAPALSADGRVVAFESYATTLVPGDTNETSDVFVRDRQSGQITRVSVDSNGAQADDSSFHPALSADGRFVAFRSFATNLVLGDTNGMSDLRARPAERPDHPRQRGRQWRAGRRPQRRPRPLRRRALRRLLLLRYQPGAGHQWDK